MEPHSPRFHPLTGSFPSISCSASRRKASTAGRLSSNSYAHVGCLARPGEYQPLDRRLGAEHSLRLVPLAVIPRHAVDRSGYEISRTQINRVHVQCFETVPYGFCPADGSEGSASAFSSKISTSFQKSSHSLRSLTGRFLRPGGRTRAKSLCSKSARTSF